MHMSRRDGIRLGTREDGPKRPSPPCVRQGRGSSCGRTRRSLPAHVSPGDNPPPGKLSRPRAERRLHALVLFPAEPLAVADRGQGDVPRARGRRRPLRPRGAQPDRGAEAARVIALRQFVRPNEYPAFTRFNLFLRDKFRCVYCGVAQGIDVRPCRAARPGRPDDLGECRHRLRAMQSARRAGGLPRRRACTSSASRSGRPAGSCRTTAEASRPTICTRRWRDYLYWDVELLA